ncbi:MAG: hypothetical protein AAGF97_10140 [Planctomycetota bacterium]
MSEARWTSRDSIAFVPVNPCQQVALLIASLPERDAASVLARLPMGLVELVTRYLPSIEIDPVQQDTVAGMLQQRLHAPAPVEDDTSIWLLDAMRAALRRVSPPTLARKLSCEVPQTIATIMSMMDVGQAAELLAELPTHTQVAVILRVRDAVPVPLPIVRELLTTLLRDELTTQGLRGVESIAQLLLRLRHATEQALLENLRIEDATLVDRLLQVKLILQDLQRLDESSDAPMDELVDAVLRLRGADPAGPETGIPHAA